MRGLISKKGSFKEFVSTYINFTVYAKDKGHTPKISSLSCSVYVVDVNDNSPTFGQSYYEVHVLENVTIGHQVIMITATERDEGRNAVISYFLINGEGVFAVNRSTVSITIPFRR